MFEGDDYNNIIWTIFLLAIAFSFWVIYTLWTNQPESEIIRISMIYFGFMTLSYVALLIEGFGRKKGFQLNLDEDYRTFPGNQNSRYLSAEYIAEIFIGLPLFIGYIWTSIHLGFQFIALSMFLVFSFILMNWISRKIYMDECLLRVLFWVSSILLLVASFLKLIQIPKTF